MIGRAIPNYSSFTSCHAISRYDFCLDSELISCQMQSFLRSLLRQTTAYFEHHPTWLNYCHPEFNVAFPFTHTGFGGLLSHRFIGENANPEFSPPLFFTPPPPPAASFFF